MAALRRLLCRAALFLCMIFLSAIESITETDLRKISNAAFLSPVAVGFAFLIAVRNSERKLALCCRCVSDCRARFFACALFAI